MSDITASAPEMLPPPPAPAPRLTPARFVGLVLLAIWAAVAVLALWSLYAAATSGVLERYGMRFVDGLTTTLRIVGLSMVIGAALSLPVAAGLMTRNPVARALATAYTTFFRGTPLLAQTFLIYYGAGQFSAELRAAGLWPFFRDATFCVVLAFALNTAAYQAEILAGAIRGVARGQWEGAGALGLNRIATLRKVVLPQAMMIALRPYGNELILMIKGSAVASIVTVYDLMGQTRFVFSRTFDLTVYIWAAAGYLVMVELLRRLWDILEARLTRHLRR